MSKIVLNLAMSLDGYIADEEGGFEWIVGHGDHDQDMGDSFDFADFVSGIGTVVMGSKAYEDCILSGLAAFDEQEIIVATSRELEGRDNVRFIQGNITKEVAQIKSTATKDIFIFGGAGVAEPFIKEDIIDQYIVGIIPTILGKGRPLFRGGNSKIDLHLDSATIADGITILFYSKR